MGIWLKAGFRQMHFSFGSVDMAEVISYINVSCLVFAFIFTSTISQKFMLCMLILVILYKIRPTRTKSCHPWQWSIVNFKFFFYLSLSQREIFAKLFTLIASAEAYFNAFAFDMVVGIVNDTIYINTLIVLELDSP